MRRLLSFVILVLSLSVCYAQKDVVRSLKQQIPHIKDSLRYVDALNRLGMLLYETNVDSLFHYTMKAREIAVRVGYEKGVADAVNNLGIVYDMQGDLQLSLRYYNEAYNHYKHLRDSSNIVQTKMNIATVYAELGKEDKSLSNFKEAFLVGKTLKHDSIMALVIYNYLLVFPKLVSNDTTLIYINKASDISVKYRDLRLQLAIDQLRADYMIKNGEREKGISKMEETVRGTLANELYYLSMDMLINLGNNFTGADSAKAVNYYRQGLAIAQEKRYHVYSIQFVKKLYDFYGARQDAANTLKYSRQLVDLYEQKDRINRDSGIDYIEYALKDQQLQSVRSKSKYQWGFLALAITVCLMTIIIIIILWRDWKNSQRTTEALRLQFKHTESTMQQLDHMNKDYARLIKIVAHDLRNPIGAIGSLTSLIRPDAMAKDDKEILELIKGSSKNCLELINELMKTDFTHQQSIVKEEIDLNELLHQCVLLLGFRAKEKDQLLLLHTAIRGLIKADKEKLLRVLNNIVSNAMKFSESDSTIQISSIQSDNEIIIHVKDTGMGIPLDLQDNIFDPFTTSKRTGTGGEQPFGLGLYISKQIIEAHGGKIWFETETNAGTTFYISIPV